MKAVQDTAQVFGGDSKTALIPIVGSHFRTLDPTLDLNGALADPAACDHLPWTGVSTEESVALKTGLHRGDTSFGDAKIQHVYYESRGRFQEWQTWRRDRSEFAPRMFEKARHRIPRGENLPLCQRQYEGLPNFEQIISGADYRCTACKGISVNHLRAGRFSGDGKNIAVHQPDLR